MIPLPREQFWKAEGPMESVPFNTLFASNVIEDVVSGKIFVDDARNPRTFLIAHPYGMSLLFGETGNDAFNGQLREYMLNSSGRRKKPEWLQVHPLGWKPMFGELLGEALDAKTGSQESLSAAPDNPAKTIEYTRVNFRFNREKYMAFASAYQAPSQNVVRTDARMFREMQGQVIPRYFWRDSDHFLGEGVGFSLLVDGKAASTAFCAFLHDSQLELGIETESQHRGKGYAVHACKALIDYSLDNGYEPVWSCRLENTGSYLLAQKLGFEPTFYLPYYQLAYETQ